MPILHDPVVTLEGVSLANISLSTLDIEVAIRVENKNPVGATLKECPFAVLYQKDGTSQQIATGNTGEAKIAASTATVLRVPVTSHNTALVGALAMFVTKGSIEVTIAGTAVIKFLMITKSVPFSRTMPVTIGQVAGIVTGAKKQG